MRLDNLDNKTKERLALGDIKFLKQVLEEELKEIKEDLIYLPEGRVSELRGRAIVVSTIIKLLPK